MIGRALGGLLAAILFAACASTTPSSGSLKPGEVRLQTLPPERGETPSACAAALLTGTLARHPQSGIGLTGAGGKVLAVVWPFGWSARDDAGRLAIFDASGAIRGHEGSMVNVRGGFGGDENTWIACGGIAGRGA